MIEQKMDGNNRRARLRIVPLLSRMLQCLIWGLLTVPILNAQEAQPLNTQSFVPPNIGQMSVGEQFVSNETEPSNPIRQVSGGSEVSSRRRPNATPAPAEIQQDGSSSSAIGTRDPKLGNRIARITNERQYLPQDAGQMYREFDITPYTKGRTFSAGTNPEQTIVDWILRQTGTKVWHSAPFGYMAADSEKLYVYHTKEVLLEIADIVDRFVTPQFSSDSCKIRVVSVSRPDWISNGHKYLRPIPILTPGVQGWIVDKDGTQLLLQELGRRSDFKEIAPPQFLIPNGIAHQVVSKRQRSYLRDVQANATALNGYAEDRVTIDEGFGVSFTPLSVLDGLKVDATIKLDIVLVEKMIPLMLDVPTATNPRQRVQIEAPQVSHFSLDEQIRWPKDKVLLLDLGTIPLPNREQSSETAGFIKGIAKGLSGNAGTSRANILLLIECVSGVSSPLSPVLPSTSVVPESGVQQVPVPAANGISGGTPTIGTNATYWQGIR